MDHSLQRPFRFALFGVLIVCLSIPLGCDYLSYYSRQRTWRAMFDTKPRMSFLQRFAPQDSVLVSGRIINPEPNRGPLLLAAVSSQYRENEIVALTTIRNLSEGYILFLPAGDYGLFVFADLNGNGLFERNEVVGQVSMLVREPEKSETSGVLEGPAITLNYGDPGKTVFRLRVRVSTTDYVYPSLDDEFFDPRYGSQGLYNPAGFMAHTQGFLFGLEEYDERKTTVLFVHGISGTPRDFKYFVEGMDLKRFQPFFLYYPSGMPLDKLGSLLALSLDTWQNGSHKVVLVAHSMGGLVALSAIQKLADKGLPPGLAMFISFSTPYGGVDSARAGVERAPYVIPVWKDIACNSEFLQCTVSLPFPAKLPFYLFFTYNDPSTFKLGESSDGTVTLSSQLQPFIQAAATKVLGFNEDHNGFLTSKAGRDAFLRLLERAAPDRRAGKSGQ
jgi:pimeloyl-ACP methyl ester carboxylesterase